MHAKQLVGLSRVPSTQYAAAADNTDQSICQARGRTATFSSAIIDFFYGLLANREIFVWNASGREHAFESRARHVGAIFRWFDGCLCVCAQGTGAIGFGWTLLCIVNERKGRDFSRFQNTDN